MPTQHLNLSFPHNALWLILMWILICNIQSGFFFLFFFLFESPSDLIFSFFFFLILCLLKNNGIVGGAEKHDSWEQTWQWLNIPRGTLNIPSAQFIPRRRISWWDIWPLEVSVLIQIMEIDLDRSCDADWIFEGVLETSEGWKRQSLKKKSTDLYKATLRAT